MGRLDSRVAVVTGGASGIGAATAALFGREGARVAVLDCNSQDAAGESAMAIRCDVSDEAGVRAAMERIAGAWGCVDILLNNAGIPARLPCGDTESAVWRRVFEVHVEGAFLCSKYALPYFPARGGAIVHMSSVAGIVGMRSRAAYSAAKGALVALTRNMALDYAPRRIRVNCVCPGFVRTPLIAPLLRDPERTARLVAMHPLGRLGEPEDVARAELFLVSDEAAWITGQVLAIDGGFAAGHPNEI